MASGEPANKSQGFKMLKLRTKWRQRYSRTTAEQLLRETKDRQLEDPPSSLLQMKRNSKTCNYGKESFSRTTFVKIETY